MNSRDHAGDEVAGIIFPNGDQRFGPGMFYHYEYHGEYDDAWVVVVEGGKEVARHSVKHLASIYWRGDPR